MIRDISNLVLSGHEVSYKLLAIGLFKYDGVQYIQVHCDRRDMEYSYMYDTAFSHKAVAKYLELHSKYLGSERKHGNFPPLEGVKSVPQQRNS